MVEERIDALNAAEERHTPEQQWNLLPSTRLHPLVPPLSYRFPGCRNAMLSRVFVVGKNAAVVNTLVDFQALPAQEIIHPGGDIPPHTGYISLFLWRRF